MKCKPSEIDIDEALEILWTLEQDGEIKKEEFKNKFNEKMEEPSGFDHRKRFRRGYRGKVKSHILDELKSWGFVKEDKKRLKLTSKGRELAKNIVRRHRLAERLFVDLLEMGKEEVEKPACEFEHLLSEEVTEQICTLLGHPQECPHGLPIPKGDCCTAEKKTIKPALKPLVNAEAGEKVRIAYIRTKNHPRLHKLLSHDIGPGSVMKIHQKKPVFIIRVNESDIAIEEEIAKDIFVKQLTSSLQ